MNVRLTAPHARDCLAIQDVRAGEISHPWILAPSAQAIQRDKNGGLRGDTTEWLKLLCLDRRCPTSALVQLDWLLDTIEAEIWREVRV